MYSSGINCVVIHIIQVNGKYCSMPVQKTTVALQFDPVNRKLKKINDRTSRATAVVRNVEPGELNCVTTLWTTITATCMNVHHTSTTSLISLHTNAGTWYTMTTTQTNYKHNSYFTLQLQVQNTLFKKQTNTANIKCSAFGTVSWRKPLSLLCTLAYHTSPVTHLSNRQSQL